MTQNETKKVEASTSIRSPIIFKSSSCSKKVIRNIKKNKIYILKERLVPIKQIREYPYIINKTKFTSKINEFDYTLNSLPIQIIPREYKKKKIIPKNITFSNERLDKYMNEYLNDMKDKKELLLKNVFKSEDSSINNKLSIYPLKENNERQKEQLKEIIQKSKEKALLKLIDKLSKYSNIGEYPITAPLYNDVQTKIFMKKIENRKKYDTSDLYEIQEEADERKDYFCDIDIIENRYVQMMKQKIRKLKGIYLNLKKWNNSKINEMEYKINYLYDYNLLPNFKNTLINYNKNIDKKEILCKEKNYISSYIIPCFPLLIIEANYDIDNNTDDDICFTKENEYSNFIKKKYFSSDEEILHNLKFNFPDTNYQDSDSNRKSVFDIQNYFNNKYVVYNGVNLASDFLKFHIRKMDHKLSNSIHNKS